MDKNEEMIELIQKAREVTVKNVNSNLFSEGMQKRFHIIISELDDMKSIVEDNRLSTTMGGLPISKMVDIGDPADIIDAVKKIINCHQHSYLGNK